MADTYSFYPGGEAPAHFYPGNFLLTRTRYDWHTPGSVDGPLIRFGQGLRFPKAMCWANHAALIVNTNGDLVEALGGGVTRTNVSKYKPLDYFLVSPFCPAPNCQVCDVRRQIAVDFAENSIGIKYGFVDAASLGVYFLTGSKMRFGNTGTMICSGLVAAALGEDVWRSDPSHVAPAQLAAYYGVNFTEVKKA